MSERLTSLEHAQAQPQNEAISHSLRGNGDFLKRLRVGQVCLAVASLHRGFGEQGLIVFISPTLLTIGLLILLTFFKPLIQLSF